MNEQKLKDQIKNLGGSLYQVGGCVRDSLLNRPFNDIDYVVEGVATQTLAKEFGEPVGHDFPVFLVNVDGESRELAMARIEKSLGDGYHDFSVEVNGVTLEQDLSRRDLTINAMAWDGRKIIDPFNGQRDLASKKLRHVSQAFQEDPLRILRVGRFAAQLGFEVSQETKDLCKKMKPMLTEIPGDRIVKELDKVLLSPFPSRFFDFLLEVDCLDVHFPEIQALLVPDKHDGTAYRHVMNLLDRAKGRFDLKILYGLLLHDLGKGVTPAENHPSHYNHDKLGIELVREFGLRNRLPSSIRKFSEQCSEFHLVLRKVPEMKPGKALKYLLKKDIEDLMLVAFLDAVYRDGADPVVEADLYADMKRLYSLAKETEQEIRGDEIVALGYKGKQIGDILLMKRIELFKTKLSG